MTVFVDKTESSHVLESYTFTFKYTGGCKQKGAGDNIGKRLSSVVLESTGCTADMKTVRTARRGLEMIVRRLITLSAFLPMLPSMCSKTIFSFLLAFSNEQLMSNC